MNAASMGVRYPHATELPGIASQVAADRLNGGGQPGTVRPSQPVWGCP